MFSISLSPNNKIAWTAHIAKSIHVFFRLTKIQFIKLLNVPAFLAHSMCVGITFFLSWMVKQEVFCLMTAKFKTFNPIVILWEALFMVYNFFRGKVPTKMLFHNKTMFSNRSFIITKRVIRTINMNISVSIFPLTNKVGRLMSFLKLSISRSVFTFLNSSIISRHLISVLFFISIALTTSVVNASVWYVRDGGGTATQCTGKNPAVYPGSGSAQPCAFNHPRIPIGYNGVAYSIAGTMASGDTLYINGDSDHNYAFTVSGVSVLPAIGDEYTNSGITYTVLVTLPTGYSSGTLLLTGSGAPAAGPSTLVVVGGHGSGTSPINYSAEGTGQAQFPMGYDDQGLGLTPACGGIGAYAYICEPNSIIPGISSTQMTTIIGTGNHQPQLWGNEGMYSVMSLTLPNAPASGTLTVVAGHGSGTSPITYTASHGASYILSVTGVSSVPTIGSVYSYTDLDSNTDYYTVINTNISGGTGTIVISGGFYPNSAGGFITLSTGSGTSPITYTSIVFAGFEFTASGVSTPPAVGDEYTTGGVTYDVVANNLVGGVGVIGFNGEANMDVENLEITQHSSCSNVLLAGPMQGIYPSSCGGTDGGYPFGPSINGAGWAKVGVTIQGTNFITKNNWWHNFGDEVVFFNYNMSNWNSSNDRIDAGGGALDDGGAMSFGGNNTMTNDVFAFGGCQENYPLPDPANIKDLANYINCADQNYGKNTYGGFALGGGFMMQNNYSAACGNWTVNYTQFLFNLKTNWDFLHCDGTGHVDLYRDRFEGSTGEAFKAHFNGVNAEETQFLGNAPVWETAPFQALKAPIPNGHAGTPWDYYVCRGAADTIFSVTPNETINFVNDDLVANCNTAIQIAAGTCTNINVNVYNSKIINGLDNTPGNGYDKSTNSILNDCVSSGAPWVMKNTSMYNDNHESQDCVAGQGNLCTSDPLVEAEAAPNSFSTMFGCDPTNCTYSTSYYSGTSLGDLMVLQPTSPLRSLGSTSGVTYTNGSTNDYNNYPVTLVSPAVDTGAIQYISCISASTGITNGFCSLSDQCCSQSCNSSGYCAGSNASCAMSGNFVLSGNSSL